MSEINYIITQSFIDFFVQFFASVIGVFLAIWYQNNRERKKRRKKVNLIASFLYFELSDNLEQVGRMLSEQRWRYLSTNFWEIYQTEISMWSPRNVAQLVSIYERINQMQRESPGSGIEFNEYRWKYRKSILTFIHNEISRLLQWYDKNTKLHSSIERAKKEYELQNKSWNEQTQYQNYEPNFKIET